MVNTWARWKPWPVLRVLSSLSSTWIACRVSPAPAEPPYWTRRSVELLLGVSACGCALLPVCV